MFFPVRILDAGGNLRQVVSSRQLSQLHWKKFDQLVGSGLFTSQKIPAEQINTGEAEGDDATLGPDPIIRKPATGSRLGKRYPS